MSHLEKIIEAQNQLKDIILKTPLIYSPGFSEEYNNDIYITFIYITIITFL